MGILLCEQNFRDVWRRNKSVSAEIGKMLRGHTHTHTHAAQLVVRMSDVGRAEIHASLYLILEPMKTNKVKGNMLAFRNPIYNTSCVVQTQAYCYVVLNGSTTVR